MTVSFGSLALGRMAGAAGAAALTLAFAAPAGAATSPHTATGGSTANVANYLGTQLVSSGGVLKSSGYNDDGLTADSVFALDALGSGGSAAAASTSAFAADISSYTGSGNEAYAGALGKSVLLAATQGANVHNFGGVDLVSRLSALEAPSGRFSDKSTYGDYSSPLTQAIDILGLKRAGVAVDSKAISYLASLQCANGGFSVSASGACSSEPDTTSFVVEALAAVGGHSSQITKAANYLASIQGADGGLRGGSGAPSENTNSTGLAAAAFTLAGEPARAAAARSFVASLEYGCSAPASLRGGIAYDKADFAKVSAQGAAGKPVGTELRATAQAVFALVPVSYASLSGAHSVSAVPALSCSASAPASSTSPSGTSSSSASSAASQGTSAGTSTAPKPTSTVGASVTKPAAPSTSAGVVASGASSTTSSSAASSSSSSAPAAAVKPVTGPKVNTDGPGATSSLEMALAGVIGLIALGGGAVAFSRRR